jgi:formylglycine-generating enzyme required for sulfatase activity
MTPKIFISYRRLDSEFVADSVYNEMQRHFGQGNVFLDVGEIPFGVDFRVYLREQIAEHDVVLVLIGPKWGDIMRERASQANDFVRIEIENALAQNKLVIPTLVMRLENMPDFSTLPASIADLQWRNVAKIRREPDFKPDCQRLVDNIKKVLNGAAKPPVMPVPRFSLPLLEWKLIRAGKVSLITENHWRDNYVPKGKPTVFEVGSFEMAKYPITNQQYAAFMKDGGYGERRWWTEAGWQAKQQKQWAEPRYWGNSQFNGLEQPVVGVSWYECVAFCHWLGDKLGERIFLPTEQQWQRAAQGDDGRTYAWGSTWDEARCNHSNNMGHTTPVSKYEGLGDSPFGVVDMTGNVWEWCSTAYETGSTALEGVAIRVLRGGSWNGTQGLLRAAGRGLGTPDFGSSYFGVRCARSPERSEG